MAESTLFHMQALDILAPLFADAAVGAAVLDRRGRVLHANPAWHRVVGEAQDAAISTATLPAALQAAVEPLLQQVLGGETVQALAVPAADAEGAHYWDLYLSPVVQNGQAEAVLLIATEATERANAEQQMRQALESARRREGRLSSTFTALEDIISAIAAHLVSLAPNDIDAGILRSLGILGEFSGADRSYIFLFAGDEQTVINTHAWKAKGLKAAALPGKDYAIQDMPWIYEVIKRGEALHVPSVNDLLPAQSPDRSLLRRIGVRSFIAVPMMYQGRVLGLLGFDTLRKERTWSAESIKLLQIVAEFLVSALEQKRAQAIQAGQRQFLELLARGGSSSETLHTLVTLIEEQWPGMLGLVLLLDENGRSLHVGAAASLPQDYLDSLEGLEIGPQVGSCGTAAYLGERVVVTDIDSDPRWENLRGLVAKHNLKACWSEPVIDSSGRVLGTFAMYYRHPRSPTEEELRTIEISAHLAGVAIEHQNAQKNLQAAYNLLEQRVDERTRELFTLLDVSHDLASTLDLQMLLGQLLDQLRAVVGYEGASVLELSGDSLRVVAYRGPIPQEQALQLHFTLQQAGANRRVIESGEPVIISDVRSDDALASEFRETAGEQLTQAFRYVRCWMGVPLVVHKKVIGMLSLDHRHPYAYRAESHGRLTQAFANQAAVAMENARLYAEARRRAEESQTLYAIQQAITSRRDPQSVLQMIADQARRLTNTEQGAVYLLEGDELRISVISGAVDVGMLGYRLPVDGSMAGLAIKTGRSYRVGEADADERVEKALVDKVGARAFVIVPLVLSTGPVGTITVANKR
ncbi:MAG TPA: GAF domain-containing protein, partial [Anaerolineales bacterium]|nr:GAF domain-containing protein [Anaerolineales bacterium]